MPDDTWKYVENQFDNSTKNSKKRMKELAIFHRDAVHGSSLPISAPMVSRTVAALPPFMTAYNSWLTARVQFKMATAALDAALTHLGSTDIEDIEVAYKGAHKRTTPEYATAFPLGREPFQSGGIDDKVTAIETLSGRLGLQQSALATVVTNAENAADPALPLLRQRLGNLTSAASLTTSVLENIQTLRGTQHGAETQVELLRTGIEPLRKTLAAAMYANLGQLMTHFSATPEQITAFFDLSKLRETGVDEEEPPVPATTPKP